MLNYVYIANQKYQFYYCFPPQKNKIVIIFLFKSKNS